MNTYEEDEVKSINSKTKKFQFMDQVFEGINKIKIKK